MFISLDKIEARMGMHPAREGGDQFEYGKKSLLTFFCGLMLDTELPSVQGSPRVQTCKLTEEGPLTLPRLNTAPPESLEHALCWHKLLSFCQHHTLLSSKR